MPTKSRHSKINHRKSGRINRNKQWSAGIITRQPVITQTSTPAIVANKVDSRLSSSASSTTRVTNPYPYINAELKSIGILTGTILFIMIVLFWLLR